MLFYQIYCILFLKFIFSILSIEYNIFKLLDSFDDHYISNDSKRLDNGHKTNIIMLEFLLLLVDNV